VTAVHVVVPDGIDDPARPSGGNTYDRRICHGLAAIGWSVHEHPVPGAWPCPDAAGRAAFRDLIATIPDAAVVLVDGLIASTVPDVLVPESDRLRLVVLVHMPLGEARPDIRAPERAVLSCATALVTTSTWTRRWLLEYYALAPGQVRVAEPGVEAADLASGTPTGGELLCVAAVTPNKGHDVLLAALAAVADLPWRCVCVGSLKRDPGFVEQLEQQAVAGGIGDRVVFVGSRVGADLDARYAAADVLVLASRAETYGMVVTEALARGLPVLATAVGGLPDALGRAPDGCRPGVLVPSGDPAALGAALRRWLGDWELRDRLRHAARGRRGTLCGWRQTSRLMSEVLAEASLGMNPRAVVRVCHGDD
jgi:glycosyltransferase involved in cell wall biosynthesis